MKEEHLTFLKKCGKGLQGREVNHYFGAPNDYTHAHIFVSWE